MIQLSLLVDFPVKDFPQQEKEKDIPTHVISGRRCYQLYMQSNPTGSLLKMSEVLLTGKTDWHSKQCVLTWKSVVTPYSRLLFQLSPSVRPTEGIGSGLSDTMLGTPRANEDRKRSPEFATQVDNLKKATNIKMLKTPSASEWDGGAKTQDKYWEAKAPKFKTRDQVGRIGVETGRKLRLQPAMTQWMQGFPTGWTILSDEREA